MQLEREEREWERERKKRDRQEGGVKREGGEIIEEREDRYRGRSR